MNNMNIIHEATSQRAKGAMVSARRPLSDDELRYVRDVLDGTGVKPHQHPDGGMWRRWMERDTDIDDARAFDWAVKCVEDVGIAWWDEDYYEREEWVPHWHWDDEPEMCRECDGVLPWCSCPDED